MSKASRDKITPIKFAVHWDIENPVYGDHVIHVSIDDEAAGPFIVLQSTDGIEKDTRLDPEELKAVFEELKAVFEAAQQLLKAYPEKYKKNGK